MHLLPAETDGGRQAANHPAMQAHMAGVQKDVLAACNAQLGAADVPHRMLEW